MIEINGKKLYSMDEGYKLIEHPCTEEGVPINPVYCIMCNELALCMAPETDEPLCFRCKITNDEARHKKLMGE